MIDIKQFAGRRISAKDDALLYDFLVANSGIFEGCTVTHLGSNQLQVSSGRGIIKGRIFTIESETISATLATSGALSGRLLVRVDISNTTTPIEFVTQAAATLPNLTQEDINRDGSVYELPLATYSVDMAQISNLSNVARIVEMGNWYTKVESDAKYALKSTTVNFTLTTTGWTGTAAPYKQVVSVPGVTADTIAVCDVAENATAAQVAAYSTAVIWQTDQGDGTITFQAAGAKPTVSILMKLATVG